MKKIYSIVAILSIYAPFIVLATAIVLLPDAMHVMSKVSGIEWIYLIAIGAMMLGMLYWLFELDVDSIRDQLFRRFDVNHDGYISRDEIAGESDLREVFDQIDVDHDDRISRTEFAQALTACGRLVDFGSNVKNLLMPG
ncbi:MAG TPA: EF-hand domain-containing protein [Burkholderiales bacterium]|nr:EF-hand domain-containing protein [Burkholderiales bacterium]